MLRSQKGAIATHKKLTRYALQVDQRYFKCKTNPFLLLICGTSLKSQVSTLFLRDPDDMHQGEVAK